MKQKALTLIEMVVIIGIIALLAVVGMPAIKALYSSFAVGSCSKIVINLALSYAKAIAQKERHYAGVLFEQKDNLQWAIPIIQDPNMEHWKGLENEKTILFIAEKGERQSINLGKDSAIAPVYFRAETRNMDKPAVVVFSPSGKIIIKSIAVYPFTKDIYSSTRAFVIYDVSDWNKIKGTVGQKDFIDNLKPLFLNTYIGNIIE